MYNIIYSSSNEYSPYMMTSIYSLLRNNRDLKDVHFYILSNDIQEQNKEKLQRICSEYSAKAVFIDCSTVISQIVSGGTLNFNPSSFVRIFIPQLLPDLDKALFIDSDTYINYGIKELYDTDISDYLCAMSYNQPIYRAMLEEASLDEESGYFNAGIILLNLTAWKKNDIQNKILKYYYDHGGNFPTDDQSIINAIVSKESLILPYKYNAMIGNFYWSYKKFCAINTQIGCKTRKEFEEAAKNPVIIHFNGPGVRPWEKFCGHPYTKIYRRDLLNINPDYHIKMPKGSKLKVYAQYFKHILLDKIECAINK